jgi:hypothetical protein
MSLSVAWWVVQIISSEAIMLPAVIETGSASAETNFYDPDITPCAQKGPKKNLRYFFLLLSWAYCISVSQSAIRIRNPQSVSEIRIVFFSSRAVTGHFYGRVYSQSVKSVLP